MSAAPTPTPTGQVAVSARRDDRTAAAIMAGIAVIAGIAGAVMWRLVVRLPAYVV